MTPDAAKIIVRLAMGGKMDRSGMPLYDHCVRVYDSLDEDIMGYYKMAGLLHDVIEDSSLTADDLLILGFVPQVVDVVVELTKGVHESYVEYIDRLCASGSRPALRVKLADNEDNTSPARMATLSQQDREHLTMRYDGVRGRLEAAIELRNREARARLEATSLAS